MPYVTDPGGLDESSPEGCGTPGHTGACVLALGERFCGLPRGSVTPSMHLNRDLGIDSLDANALQSLLEVEFGFAFSPGGEERFETVGQVIATIERRIAEVP